MTMVRVTEILQRQIREIQANAVHETAELSGIISSAMVRLMEQEVHQDTGKIFSPPIHGGKFLLLSGGSMLRIEPTSAARLIMWEVTANQPRIEL